MTLEETFRSTLTAAQNGEEPAWTTIFDELAPAVHAYMRVRGARDAEDLVGEVFLQIARNLTKFEGNYRAFRSWVFIVAHHRVIDDRRQTRRYRETFDSQPLLDRPDPVVDVEAEAIAGLDTSWIADALSDLTDSQRDVIVLRVLGELSVEDTARAIGKRPGTVRVIQHRALSTLRDHLTKDM